MITEWFIELGVAIAGWFTGLFGEEPPPDWLTGVAGFLGEMFTRVAGLGAWVPFVLLGSIAAFQLTLWLVLWSVKGIRWLWGLTPFSGGS